MTVSRLVKRGLAFVSIISVFTFAQNQYVHANDMDGCVNAEVLGPKLLTDICWSCLFPIRIAGVSMNNEGNVPNGASNRVLCSCTDGAGVPHPGVSTSMWEPARLVEFQRVPGCMSALNGTRLPFNRLRQGSHGNGEFDGGDGSFMHYHYYAFPLLILLDLFVKDSCNADGYMDFDIMYLSELDPTWNNPELAFFANPEAAAVANPAAVLACSADAVASTSGNPIESMFWCAGSWGNMYPLSGKAFGASGMIQNSSLLTARVLASLHRRGMAWRTMGDDAMCYGGRISPLLPKTQYKFTMFHPMPETDSSHVMGESTLKWGQNRIVPVVGEDPIYTIWRWNDCCNF